MTGVSIVAALALLPLAIGPVQDEERSIVAALCDGGTITIPLGDDGEPGVPDCSLKACHAGNCRKRFDPSQ